MECQVCRKYFPKYFDVNQLKGDDLKYLSSLFEIKTFSKGDVLFYEGTSRETFFIIMKGELEVSKKEPAAKRKLIVLREGDCVVEGLFLDDSPHSTNAEALTDIEALLLTREQIRALKKERPAVFHTLMEGVAKYLNERLQFSGSMMGGTEPIYSSGKFRVERDLLGERQVPDGAYYGIQTLRAVENFPITGIPISHFPNLIKALAMVKKAAAIANFKLGLLTEEIHDAIARACDEIIEGALHKHFVVDVIQGGAGTSTNMNANEVIANRAIELLGGPRGDYHRVHPNNHVNLSQSTNDAYPTALKVGLLLSLKELENAMLYLLRSFREKEREFEDVIKMGRTQLQDAVPMTLGQEFGTYATMLEEDVRILGTTSQLITEINMGGTAIGTGINADPEYVPLVCEELRKITGLDLKISENLVEATQDTGAFVQLSGVFKRIVVKLSKVCNDLRLLSSGPRAGLREICLPPMQPGSSIMPGKVNPVIPEVFNQVAYQVVGNDLTVTMAGEAGQLQLNVMEPVIAFQLLQSIDIMRNAMITLADRCIKGITANREVCRKYVENSIGIVTVLNPCIGYENASAIAKEALQTGKSVCDLVLEKGLLTKEEIERMLSPDEMIRPRKVRRH
jgi:aspartate ammonia-lyase